ncbi:uncharacterized protein SETTUDRAFT_29245 [Exserohilum turcica Et28A]|uniref:Glycoside hydrolase 131 catalytic N-terminal domain-containing protein n=1 Tax=Exserohilum turcicum (strain 28A) TaxID=671987 RepID=R0K4J0_EXST2|nr:uncharacterized protein SETTUDRAFT_29245 [Exserohilum turcica Et28A]EOA84464.1 hypothetical protein SETTUDRAFT_29245 [Exserohilum turcica Et28A]
MFTQTLFSALLLASSAFAVPQYRHNAARAQGAVPKCPIVFDGRVPLNLSATDLDSQTTNTIFNAQFVKGNNLTWSQIVKFPQGASRFDGDKFKPIEVTLSDESIFQKQKGFRRAELQFLKDAADGEGAKGIKTLHWSVMQDPARPLNFSHEYLNVWHEAADFSSNQIQFQTGTLIGKNNSNPKTFKILNRKNEQLWSVPVCMVSWQNFAVTLDYTNNQVTIFYSKGKAPLAKVAGPIGADLSGGGQHHIGGLKKPTGTSDVANAGFQEANLNEGQIYGGLFLEDSTGGCVSL